MKTNEAIQLWKEENIQRCEMEFSCGGDSMNDTHFNFFNKNKEDVQNSDLFSYFDEAVYKNVEFYVNSDGEYLGEYGTVIISLNEDETGFVYDKQSTSEYSEIVSEYTKIPVSPEEEVLFEKISSFEIIDGEELMYTYNGDVLLSEDEIIALHKLQVKIQNFVEGYSFEFDLGERSNDLDASAEFEQLKDGNIEIRISARFYVEKEN